MPDTTAWIAFSLLCFGMVLTPGPNMIYLISRSISQGTRAGMISLAGVALGFVFYMVAAALGISAILMAVPYAYDALRFAGVIYLLYLAWQALKPGARSPFEVRNLPSHGVKKLFLMGFLTNLLNPKIAIIYLSLLPQFIKPELGHVLGQSLVLGGTQVVMSITVNGLVALSAGAIATTLAGRPMWLVIQRWIMGTALFALAVRMALDSRK
ncbi:MAG: LysE family translocator [Comamonadaceae bacterium]|nr:MAG: LysE family translocator [Comamonadaceae bacterium]